MEMVNHLRKFPALLFKGKAVEEGQQPTPELKFVETSLNQELILNLKDVHNLNIDSKSALLRLEFHDDDRAVIKLQGLLKAAENHASPQLKSEREAVLQKVVLHFPTCLQPVHCQLLINILLPHSFRRHMEIQSTSGAMEITGGILDQLLLSTISGNLKIEALNSKKLILKTISGSISLTNAQGNIDASTTSGDIVIDSASIDNKINIHTTSGNSTIKLPSKSEFQLDGITTTGKLVQPPQKSVTGLGHIETTTERIYLRSVSGDFQLIHK